MWCTLAARSHLCVSPPGLVEATPCGGLEIYFQTRDRLSCGWDNGSPDIHGHCPSCSGTHKPSLPPTSLQNHAETPFHTLPQHLKAYKTDDPPIPEDQAQLSACLCVPALTSREHDVLSYPLLQTSIPPHSQTT